MGTVYLAEDTHLGRRVAVKFPSLTSDSHDHRARFLREARAVSELNHPGIATLFDYGETSNGRPFLVMELAKGRPLTDLMQNGELSLVRVVEIVSDIAAALAAAHARGVVHRDIKPSNIMIDDEGAVKVLDFGLAKQLIKDTKPSATPEAQTLLSTETRSGVVLGTPAYLSPEQAVGGAVDGRSDVFALGTLLYEAITGRTPFAGGSFIEIAANVLHVEPTPPSKINAQIPRELEFATLKALAKKPHKRYQSAKELIADLTEVKKRLEDVGGHTLIRRTSSSITKAPGKTLSNLSQILQRPRIPISYILIGAVVLILGGGLALHYAGPKPHKPTEEADRWYQLGTKALRDGAYHQASQAFERAIAADDNFMLAHARFAESLVELDYSDRAKDELLRVRDADRAKMAEVDSLYLDAITATATLEFSKAIEVYRQIAGQLPESEIAYMLVDLGRTQSKDNKLDEAIQSFTQAAAKNPQYATAYLQLGIAWGKKGELAKAMSAFEQAESIYQASGNLEGRIEVVFQRGALLNQKDKLREAKQQLEQALVLARANDNKSQIIKTLLQLSSLAFDEGETSRSSDYAQEAVDLAQRSGMENLSAQALVDLGNSFVVRGQPVLAEKYLSQALASAVRAKARRTEARARVPLGNMLEQQNQPDEAIRYVEPALAFYQQGGYRTETFRSLVVIARANLRKGQIEAAQASHEQLLKMAQEWNDQSLLALAHTERGAGLAREEKFTEALSHMDHSLTYYRSQGVQRSIGYNLVDRSGVLWRLGRYDEIGPLLEEAARIANKPGGEIKRLSVSAELVESQVALSQGHFRQAQELVGKVIERAGTEFVNISSEAKIVLALAQSYGGATAAGKETAQDLLDSVKKLNDPVLLANAQLTLAETQLIVRDHQGALTNALQAQEAFARMGLQASEWRALLIAAQALQNSSDKSRAREYAMRAKDSLSKLEQRWTTDSYNRYLSRPDVDRLRKQLVYLTGSAG